MTPKDPAPGLAELANGPIDDVDDALLRRLGEGYERTDPVPGGLVDRIKFGITLNALEAELAELQRTGSPVGVRSNAAAEQQTVTFTSSRLTTMVTITALGVDRVRIDGWIAPGGGVEVELRTDGQTLSTVADSNGRFVFEDVPRGLAQFTLRVPSSDAPPVVTPSIVL